MYLKRNRNQASSQLMTNTCLPNEENFMNHVGVVGPIQITYNILTLGVSFIDYQKDNENWIEHYLLHHKLSIIFL